MVTFALIAEGITDQIILEAIIDVWCRESLNDDIDVNFLQPARDATDNSRTVNFGGWERVLEYCTFSDRLSQALAVNDYLVVHIDTDSCEHPNFGIGRTEGGVAKDVKQLVTEVTALLSKKMGDFYVEHEDRIIFSVSVHSIECWIIPIYATLQADRVRILNCFEHLGRALKKKNKILSKDYKSYSHMASFFKKKKDVTVVAVHSESLNIFLDSLP